MLRLSSFPVLPAEAEPEVGRKWIRLRSMWPIHTWFTCPARITWCIFHSWHKKYQMDWATRRNNEDQWCLQEATHRLDIFKFSTLWTQLVSFLDGATLNTDFCHDNIRASQAPVSLGFPLYVCPWQHPWLFTLPLTDLTWTLLILLQIHFPVPDGRKKTEWKKENVARLSYWNETDIVAEQYMKLPNPSSREQGVERSSLQSSQGLT